MSGGAAREANGGVLLLIGSGKQLYREYLIRGLAERVPLWLVAGAPPTWQQPYVVGSSVVETPEGALVPDEQALVDAAAQAARTRPVLGLCTYEELLVISAAHAAERLGVRGLTVSGAKRCRDKHGSREALTNAGLPQPRYALVRSAEEAAEAALRIGYPLVLKPRGMAASVGVVRVGGPEDLADAFGVVTYACRYGPPAFVDGVLVEELVDGPEISVDGAVADGTYLPFCLARKQLGPPPYFEEIGHLVDAADPLLRDGDLRRVLTEAHRALGVRHGVTHTEVRLSARGPVIIEVNARIGGDLIPYLGLLATGIDPGHIAADVAVGGTPSAEPTRTGCAGIRFLYPPADCRIREVSVPEPGAVPGLVTARAMAEPGAVVRLPPRSHLGRYAFVLVTADDPAQCELRLDRASALVGLDHETPAPSELVGGRPW